MDRSRASVVLVNYRSPDHTLAAIEGLRALDWPNEDLEIIVVDNASGDGSAQRLRKEAGGALVIASDTNLGFAGGCNLGVERATGDLVAFLNNDARPDPNWLSAAVAAIRADASIGCVASKILDWDGVETDFVASGMSFDGQGYKFRVGLPDHPAFDEATDVLFASGAAMIMPTALFRSLGGFDDRFFMFFEDVDLGWRTWLAGYRVRYLPSSIAYHRHHATMERYGTWFERYLLDRNALFTIYKNYSDATLERALPAALLLTARRATSLGGHDRHQLDLECAPSLDDVDRIAVSKHTVAGFDAIDSFLEHLPSLTQSRREIQESRVRSDAEIEPLLVWPLHPNVPTPDYREGFDAVVEAFRLEEAFSGRRRIVIATADTLTSRMAGPAIRAWHLAKALSLEHEVILTTKSYCDISHPRFQCRGGSTADDWRELEQWCDVIIFQGFLLHDHPWLVDSNKVIVVDLYDPFHLEQLELSRHDTFEQRSLEIGQSVRVLNEQILRGDFFLCASDKQRDFWLGQLSAMQRVNPSVYDRDESLERLIAVVPFGVSDESPVRSGPGIRGVVPGIGPDDKVLIWGGGIYNWFDPLTLIRAVDALRKRVPEVRLFFLGTKHPNPDVPEMRVAWEAQQLASELGLLGSHVFFNEGWVPYEERQNYFLDADIGVSTHLDHVETQFSFRTRVLDYFWTSLPVVSTHGDTLGSLIEHRGLGLTVPAEDVAALEEALHRMLTDEELVQTCRANVDRIAEELRWTHVLEPVVEFCRRAERAPDALVHQPILDPRPGLIAAHLPDSRIVQRVAAKLQQVRAALREGGPLLVARKAIRWTRTKALTLVGERTA